MTVWGVITCHAERSEAESKHLNSPMPNVLDYCRVLSQVLNPVKRHRARPLRPRSGGTDGHVFGGLVLHV